MGKASLLFVGNSPFGMLALATAADLNPQNPLMTVVERELHFISDEGTDIAVPPGSYAIGPGSESHPTVTFPQGNERCHRPGRYDESPGTGVLSWVLLMPDDPDILHVVLLLPGGKALDADEI